MTLLIKSIIIEVFQHPTEEKNLIFKGINSLLPSIEQIKDLINSIDTHTLFGYHKNEILLHTLEINKKRIISTCFSFLIEKILVHSSHFVLFEKIDENGELHLRIDKQTLIGSDEVYLVDKQPSNNLGIYKIIIKFAYHGKKSEKIDEIHKFLSSITSKTKV